MIPLCLSTYRILLPVAESGPMYKVWSTLRGGNLKKEKCTLQMEHQVSLHKSTGCGLQPLFTPLSLVLDSAPLPGLVLGHPDIS